MPLTCIFFGLYQTGKWGEGGRKPCRKWSGMEPRRTMRLESSGLGHCCSAPVCTGTDLIN